MSETGGPSVLDAVRDYIRRGWRPVPIPPRAKRPMLKGWPELRLCDEEVAKFFKPDDNVGLILGEPSAWLVDVDLDCAEARELADQYLPPTPAVTGRASAPGSHRWYYAEDAATKKHKDPLTGKMIVELRSTGTQSVVGPSVHPEGERYEVLTGEPARVAGPMLTACVAALAAAVTQRRHPTPPQEPPRVQSTNSRTHGDPGDVERRALAYLERLPGAVSGQGGHSATYTAAVALVHGFGIGPERALKILLQDYNPRCQPPWTEKELAHKVEDAATKPHERPYRWLMDAERPREVHAQVDISQIVAACARDSPLEQPVEEHVDPGPIPDELLRVPGFVSEVMDYCLTTAPYPNPVLAFGGALALQAFLAGRKVRDQADNRTNIYLLGLAFSSVGKDWPRKVNVRIAHEAGQSGCLGERFASGEGIQDALCLTPTMMFQTDEIDGMLQSINKAKDARHENIMSTLLTLYSAANSVHPMRRKAGKESPGAIDQPCLVIYGSANPKHYYEALSDRMLTNGFFARMVILESGRRNPGQEPRICELPQRVVEIARWWADFHPGTGNLENWHPVPAVVEYADDGRELLIESRRECEAEYAKAEERGDAVGTTVWGRVNEHARKLALLYAISANHETPLIDSDSARWATRFAMHQTRRMLFMAQSHVAENPFHAECLKFLQKLRGAPNRMLSHSVALKRMKMDARSFQSLVQTLDQQGDIEVTPVKTAGRAGIAYRLLRS